MASVTSLHGARTSASSAIAASLQVFGTQAKGFGRSWFPELVASYLRWRTARQPRVRAEGATQAERAETIIRNACIKASLTGAAAGTLATSATVFTTETGAAGALFAVPAGLLILGSEMLARAAIHLEMTCDLADIFEVPFAPKEPEDLWRLYALAFHTEERAEELEDQDREFLHRIIDPEDREVGRMIGQKLIGESVLRNVVPFVGVATSAIANWQLTRHVGDTVRRYCRYQRALRDIIERHPGLIEKHLDLVIEGVWFIFTADGHLTPEEAATLAQLLRKATTARRRALENRLIADEEAWLHRLARLPKGERAPFLDLLEVAAAMDKAYSERERTLIARAAEALGKKMDPRRVPAMVRQFNDVGVLEV